MFLVFNGKGSLLEGSNPKLEDKKVPGITVYVSYLCSQYLLAGRHLFLSSPDFMILFNDFATFLKGAKHTCALFTRNSQRKKPIRKQRSAPFVKRDRLWTWTMWSTFWWCTCCNYGTRGTRLGLVADAVIIFAAPGDISNIGCLVGWLVGWLVPEGIHRPLATVGWVSKLNSKFTPENRPFRPQKERKDCLLTTIFHWRLSYF